MTRSAASATLNILDILRTESSISQELDAHSTLTGQEPISISVNGELLVLCLVSPYDSFVVFPNRVFAVNGAKKSTAARFALDELSPDKPDMVAHANLVAEYHRLGYPSAVAS